MIGRILLLPLSVTRASRLPGWSPNSASMRNSPVDSGMSSLAATDDDAVLRQDLTSLHGAVTRLAGHCQQVRVMLPKVVVLMHGLPPCLRVGAQMRWCFECCGHH